MSIDVAEDPSASVVRDKRFKKKRGPPVLGVLGPDDKSSTIFETSATNY